MAVQRTFQAIITVLDRTAGPLRAIQARLRGLAPATLTAGQNLALLRDRLIAIGQTPAMQRLGEATRLVGARLAGLARTAQSVALGMGALAGAAGLSAVGFVAMLRSSVDLAGELADTSARLGITVTDLQAYRFAAEQAGASSESLTGGMERLQKGMAEAAAGKNQNLAALFQQLRIPLRDANGQIRSAADLMPELANAFARNENPAVRTRMAMALFGRAGAALIPMLAQGSAELRKQTDLWRRINGVFTDENTPAMDALGDRMNEVKHAALGVRNAIALRLLPTMGPLLERLRDWIAANRDLFAQTVADWVKGVVSALQSFDWAGLVRDVRGTVDGMSRFAESMGGLRNVLIGLMALAIAPFLIAVGKLAGALGGALLAGLLAVGKAVAALGFGAAVALAGKFLLVAAVIGGAAYLIIKHWTPIREFFAGLWRGVIEMAERAMAAIQPVIDAARSLMRSTEGNGAGSNPAAQAQQRQRFGGRGALGGFYSGPALDPDASPIRPQSFTPGAAGAGALDIRVRFDDMPRGARVAVDRKGGAPEPRLDVGYARLGAA